MRRTRRLAPDRHEVWPNLWVGDLDAAYNLRLASDPGWWTICVREGPHTPPGPNTTCLPVLKRGYARRGRLEKLAREIDARLADGKQVLVHCWAGVERSPLTVTWWLRTRQGMTLDEAYAHIMARRTVWDRREWMTPGARAA
ncbi:MAG TPA: dual specificity protein phosphatase [Chloroflexota bacterium]